MLSYFLCVDPTLLAPSLEKGKEPWVSSSKYKISVRGMSVGGMQILCGSQLFSSCFFFLTFSVLFSSFCGFSVFFGLEP